MALVRVFSPRTAPERLVVVAMLEAHGIPTLDHNGHIASLLPGVQIDAYNTASIMVPEEHLELAETLLADFRADPPATKPDVGSVVRNIAECVFAGWFVPRERGPDGPQLARLAALHDAPEAPTFRGEKVGFAVMIADSAEGIVLVFNRWRRVWELPGGLVDPGESPRSTATRELREEAGCEALDVRWLGVVEVDDGQRHFGGVFRCSVASIPPKTPDEEIGGIACWLPDRAPPGLGATDEALLERFGRVP